MGQRYPTDLTEAEWTLLAPLIPAAKPGGRPRTTDMREVVNAILGFKEHLAENVRLESNKRPINIHFVVKTVV